MIGADIDNYKTFSNPLMYSFFCNSEEKDSIVVSKSEDSSSLKDSCYVSFSELHDTHE